MFKKFKVHQVSSEAIYLSEVSHAIDLKEQQMTSRTQILTAKQKKSLKFKNSMVARIIDGDDELKKKHDVPNNSHYRFVAINYDNT